jgi:3-oxoacyl-[acyl-carrier protein] reductase
MAEALEGRVAIVTGAGRGIGKETALALARAGCAVALAARTVEEIERLAAEIVASGGRAIAVVTDVTNEGEVEALARRAAVELGPVDILVNNAGYNRRAPIWEVTFEDWRQIIDVNTTGTFLCTKAVLPAMMERRTGKIINVSSGAGKRGSATRAAYSAAKFGVTGFGEAIQRELKDHGVTVSTVFPGPIATEMRRQNNPDDDPETLIGPEEVAEAILFLATRGPKTIIPEIEIYPRFFIS